MSRENSALDIIIGITLAFLVCAPVCALVTAWGAGVVWDWFLLAEFGKGPSAAAWFGVSLIAGLMLHGVARKAAPEDSGVIATITILTIGHVLAVLMCLASAYVVRAVAF